MGVRAEQEEPSYRKAQLLAQLAAQPGLRRLADLDLAAGELPLVRERTRPRAPKHERPMAVQQDRNDDGNGDAVGHAPPSRPSD